MTGLDAPTVELVRPLPVPPAADSAAGTAGRRGWTRAAVAATVGGALTLGAAGLLAALVPTTAPVAPAGSSVPSPSPAAVVGDPGAAPEVPTPGGLALPAVDTSGAGDAGDLSGALSPQAPQSPSGARSVPGGLVGLSTDDASERLEDAGFPYVRFVNQATGDVLVPSDLYRVTSAPAVGSLADPDVSLVVYAAQKPPSYTLAQARAANAKAEERYRAQQRELEVCGLYGFHESDPDCVAAQAAVRRTGGR